MLTAVMMELTKDSSKVLSLEQPWALPRVAKLETLLVAKLEILLANAMVEL